MSLAILCVDIGTSSLKAAIINDEGRVLAHSRQTFIYRFTDHAATEWIGTLKVALEKLGTVSTKPTAICISGNGPTIVSATGETLLWSEKVDQNGMLSLFIPRIKAFKEKYGDSFKKSEYIYSGPEYLIHALTNANVTILPESRYKTAYWTEEELDKAGFSKEEIAKLPQYVLPGTVAGTITKKASDILSSPLVQEGMNCYTGAPDFISALVGTNTLQAGKLCDRAGSSEGLNLCTTVPIKKDGIRVLPSVIKNLWNASYLLPNTGSTFSNFKQKVERMAGQEIDFETLVAACIQNPENVPILEQGKYMMIQTALTISDGLKLLYSETKNLGLDFPTEMTVTGGQASNDDWNRMKANITGMKINVPYCTDAELIGDAAFAFLGMKVYDTIEDAAQKLHKIEKVFEPKNLTQESASQEL